MAGKKGKKGMPENETKKQAAQQQDESTENVTETQQDAKTAPQEAPKEKSELEQLQEKYNDLNDRYLRTLAEYDNFRKRSQKERDLIYPEAQASTVAQFLPVLDNFERAMSFECNDEEFKKGMEMISQSFQDVMQKLGVEAVGEAGEAFDPLKHNAVMHVEDEEQGEGIVVEVFQKGYKIGDKVVRYAMVKVAN